jgi:DNA polymerase-3 subunit gamma/tau
LKTLEEPPEHVKFLFATTDPEKLLVTVLSRCLQFNLKRLDEQQISGQITRILEAEGIPAEAGAIRQLSKAADGSLRDGLSLLDQAIAYTGGKLDDAAVAAMLGTVDRTRVGTLLDALSRGDGAGLLAEVGVLAEFSPDWGGVLDALADALHRIQVRQLVADAPVEGEGVDIEALAAALRPEVVQLWYQMALNGRRDLQFAPSPRAGFEMSLLRMLAFRPAESDATRAPAPTSGATRNEAAPARAATPANMSAANAAREALARDSAPRMPELRAPEPRAPELRAPVREATAPQPAVEVAPEPVRATTPAAVSVTKPTSSSPLPDADAWHALIASSGLRGPARLLAEHSVFIGYDDGVLKLALPASDEHLKSSALIAMMATALTPALGTAPQIRFENAPVQGESLRERNERARDERQSAAEAAFMTDPDVQRLISQHGAKLVPDSIRPFDEN